MFQRVATQLLCNWVCWLCKLDKCVFEFVNHWWATNPGVSQNHYMMPHPQIVTSCTRVWGWNSTADRDRQLWYLGAIYNFFLFLLVLFAHKQWLPESITLIFHVWQLLFRCPAYLSSSSLKKKIVCTVNFDNSGTHIFPPVVLTLKSKVKKTFRFLKSLPMSFWKNGKNRTRSQKNYDGRKFWRHCVKVFDITWGSIYFLNACVFLWTWSTITI